MALSAGTKLGPYEIQSPLGAGGMGEVYRARDGMLGRDVAIKVLQSAFSGDPDRLRRFQQEAQAAAALSHPNILAIYHVGEQNGNPYIVSELLEGESLRQRLQAGPLPVRKAVDNAIQVARGLAAAHDKGIVHRDLKPENIFIARDSRVKILDFGLAKLTRPEGTSTDSPTLTFHSEPGVVLGTVGYMSPEQVRGAKLDPRSDLFSLGAILYEMLTGKRAFHGATAADTMSAILIEDPPDLAEANRQIPPALERIVRHCLEKKPEERFQSARDVAFDLDALSGLSTAAAMAKAKFEASKWIFPFAAALVLLLLGAAGDYLLRKTALVPLPTFHQLTFKRGLIYSARFAPDGQTVLYSASWDGQGPQLYSTGPDSPESRALDVKDSNLFAGSAGAMAVSVGCRFVFIEACEGTLASMPLSGGAPREIAEHVYAADWTPDGSRMAIVRQVSGKYRVEFPLGKVLYESIGWLRYVRISPRGDAVAFAEHPQQGNDVGYVVVLDVLGHRKLYSGPWTSVEGLGWSPRGDEVWVAATKEKAWADEIHGLDLSGRDRILLRLPGVLRLHDISRDGRILLSKEIWRAGILFRASSDTNERDLSWLDYSLISDVSPDHNNVAFFEPGEASGKSVFAYARRADGAPAVKLGDCQFPVFSPNEKWVLCASVSGDQLEVIPIGAGETQTVSANQIVRYGKFGWLPDDKGIFFEGYDGRGWRIYTQDLSRGNAVPVTPEILTMSGRSYANLVSPDGKFVEARDLNGSAKVYPLAGGDPRLVQGMENEDVWMNWSSDGHSGYVHDWATVPARVYRLDLSTGKKRLLFELAPGDPVGLAPIRAIRITPDGKSYAYTYERVLSELYLVQGVN